MLREIFEDIRNEAITSVKRIFSLTTLIKGLIGYLIIFLISLLFSQLLHITNWPIMGIMFLVSVLYWFLVGIPQQKPHSNVWLIDKELVKEIEYFEANVEKALKEYSNKFVAIKNQKVIFVGDSYAEVSEKIRSSKYKKEKCVLIRKVQKEQPMYFIPFPLLSAK